MKKGNKGGLRGLIQILKEEFGIAISRKEETAVEEERRASNDTTADIIVRRRIAPPEVVAQAVEVAKQTGSIDGLESGFADAKKAVEKTRWASTKLKHLAHAIAGGK